MKKRGNRKRQQDKELQKKAAAAFAFIFICLWSTYVWFTYEIGVSVPCFKGILGAAYAAAAVWLLADKNLRRRLLSESKQDFRAFFAVLAAPAFFVLLTGTAVLHTSVLCCGKVETYSAEVVRKERDILRFKRDKFYVYTVSPQYGSETFHSESLYLRLPDRARVRIRKHISPIGTLTDYQDIHEDSRQ